MQKQRIATILALLLLPTVCQAAVRTMSLSGTINKTLNIRMELKIDSGKISGSYFYEQDKTPITLKGTMDGSGKFEIQEVDAQGKVTGTFLGEATSKEETFGHEKFEGDWTKPGSDQKLPFALQVDPVYRQGKSSGWAGEWNYTKGTQFYFCSITIGNEQPGSFDFIIEAGSGANQCEVDGTAQISGTKASWTDSEWTDSETPCKVTMTLKAGKLALKTGQCWQFCGAGTVFADGEYRHGGVKWKEKDLVELGVLKKAQQKELQRLSGKDFDLFVNSFHLIEEEEDLDGMGIKGTSGYIRGLNTYSNAIVLYRPDGKMWAAVIDTKDDTVKYFTNDPAYAGKLLKTIDKWRESFADKKVLFMSKTK
jgi:hypothetical protein